MLTSCAFQLLFGRIYTFYTPKYVYLVMIGLFAIGTSCLALVCVIGRRRVPAPPARIKPFMGFPA